VVGDDEAGHHRPLAVAGEQRLSQEGRRRCPADTRWLLVRYGFGSESVTTSQSIGSYYCGELGLLVDLHIVLIGFDLSCAGTRKVRLRETRESPELRGQQE
jgi:hypothetical protein